MNLPAEVSAYILTSVCGTGARSKTSSFGAQAATRHSCKYRWLRAPATNLFSRQNLSETHGPNRRVCITCGSVLGF
jgi:hypothetical protein